MPIILISLRNIGPLFCPVSFLVSQSFFFKTSGKKKKKKMKDLLRNIFKNCRVLAVTSRLVAIIFVTKVTRNLQAIELTAEISKIFLIE